MTLIEDVAPIDATVGGYFAMWNEADPARRRGVTAITWAQDARYIDPMFAAEGYDALDALVIAVHEQFPGHRFRLVGVVDAHHERARWD